MKRVIRYKLNKKTVEREISYIPGRFIVAMLLTVLEIVAIIGIVVALCMYVPYFYILAMITSGMCVLKIISSDDNPDYKVPWILFVLILPVAGFMLYFMFYKRSFKKKFIKRAQLIANNFYKKPNDEIIEEIDTQSVEAGSLFKMTVKISSANVFKNTKLQYFPLGEDMWKALLEDLKKAEKFIYMEYFIIEEGKFWDSILEILIQKASQGVDVQVLYDDIGCMKTLPGAYWKELKKHGIKASPFARLRGQADNEFNNRNHRKITVIDGYIGYTGGINIADEYVNERKRFGHWKDTAVRLEGEAVWELTKTFVFDFGINVKKLPPVREDLYPAYSADGSGYVIPFTDGPRPLFERCVGKSVIQQMLNNANKYAYIMTPYLIIDNDLSSSIENASLRGVDVKIIVPHIPDKKFVFGMTRSFYNRFLKCGVEIYEYEPGFIHAKNYLIDDEYAMLGTINLDYRSLVHHFENGVLMYKTDIIKDIKADFDETLKKCIKVTEDVNKIGVFRKLIRSFIRIFSPLM